MKITEPMRQMVLRALREKKMTKVMLASEIGMGKAWVTKLLDGTLQTIKEEHYHELENLLGFQFREPTQIEQLTNISRELAERFENDAEFAKVVISIRNLLDSAKATFTPRFIPTEKMSHVGAEIIKIVNENPEKPGKVARLVLELLA